jgi:hypothetical protein
VLWLGCTTRGICLQNRTQIYVLEALACHIYVVMRAKRATMSRAFFVSVWVWVWVWIGGLLLVLLVWFVGLLWLLGLLVLARSRFGNVLEFGLFGVVFLFFVCV